jgi:hypothetical protein
VHEIRKTGKTEIIVPELTSQTVGAIVAYQPGDDQKPPG